MGLRSLQLDRYEGDQPGAQHVLLTTSFGGSGPAIGVIVMQMKAWHGWCQEATVMCKNCNLVQGATWD